MTVDMAAPRVTVWIRVTRRVDDLFLTPPNEHYAVEYPLRAQYAHPRPATIEVMPAGDPAKDHTGLAVATIEMRASARVAQMLSDLASGRVPVGTQEPELPPEIDEAPPLFDPDTRELRVGESPPFDLMPQPLQSFQQATTSEALDLLKRTVKVMRWRKRARGPHNPFLGAGPDEFSLDSVAWHPLPQSIHMRTSSRGSLSFRGSEWNEVQSLVENGTNEPFSFELFREARGHQRDDLRSALVIGVAALELAAKECISSLIPDATWLVQEAPSPPVHLILREYLPKLPARNRIDGRVPTPPEDQLERLRKGIGKRNQLAHSGPTNVSRDEVDELLNAIEDVLWLLAYYSGAQWALRYVTVKTRAALGAPLDAWEREELTRLGD